MHLFDSTLACLEIAPLSVTAASGWKHCTKTHLSSQVDPSDSSAHKFHKLHRLSFFVSWKLLITALSSLTVQRDPRTGGRPIKGGANTVVGLGVWGVLPLVLALSSNIASFIEVKAVAAKAPSTCPETLCSRSLPGHSPRTLPQVFSSGPGTRRFVAPCASFAGSPVFYIRMRSP